jgi:hypothetical protein
MNNLTSEQKENIKKFLKEEMAHVIDVFGFSLSGFDYKSNIPPYNIHISFDYNEEKK